ncbi:hypothetical protein DU002_14550 [Corallincola holothuriorum]|uniref:Uncharacterized protein n=1 Tax=Corallincola holothuriorum TaxID=2282215 RepID=A0A368N516_9GAMM|nr:hypothetical protein [Corallincola holothuriorum]RCU45677.1 hypothetical protein DU002_14550 [Corallincola holothuriorum]
MADLLWVKMPSSWVTDEKLASSFSSKASVSKDIAALKIFLYMCLFANPIKRRRVTSPVFYLPERLMRFEEVTQAEAQLTYDDICEGCSLSRKLVRDGLRKLIEIRLVVKEGTTRKIRYVVQGSLDSGWAKLPKRELIKLDNKVAAFHAIKNRYEHERNALKLFIYLLTVRTNRFKHIDVSRNAISKATGIDLYQIDDSLGFLQGIGLIEDIKSKGYLARASQHSEGYKLHRYFLVGSAGLVGKGGDVNDVIIDIPD